jgi:SLT domain-containing protein
MAISKKKGGKMDAMEKILKSMSAKERKAFLESMGFATKDAEGVSRSYRKAGGKMKSKGYKAGGKMKSKGYAGGGKVKQEKALELKKKAGPKKSQNKKKETKNRDLFGGLLLGGGYQRGTMPGDTFKAGGKIKSKGYKAGGKMKSKGYKAGGKMKKKPQSGHNRLY